MKRYLTTLEFSKATGIAQGTLRRWNAEGVLIPAQANGRGKPALYSEEQLQADAVKNFKPRAWTKQETTDLSLADRVNCIRKLTGDTARNLIEIGRHLAAAKSEVGHGNWANWLDENFQWTERTARNFMALAERFGDNPEFATFKPSTLQAMLSLPAGDEEKFIAEQADAGRPVETQSARQLKENVKQHNQKKSKGTKRKTFSDLEPTNPAITPTSNVLSDLEHVDEVPAVIDVDAVITPADLTQQEEESATISATSPAADAEPADNTEDDLSPYIPPVDESSLTPAEYEARRLERVADMNKHFDAMIESLLSSVAHVEVLHHMRDYIIKRVDEQLAALEGKKISL